jgi:hypothetical protein
MPLLLQPSIGWCNSSTGFQFKEEDGMIPRRARQSSARRDCQPARSGFSDGAHGVTRPTSRFTTVHRKAHALPLPMARDESELRYGRDALSRVPNLGLRSNAALPWLIAVRDSEQSHWGHLNCRAWEAHSTAFRHCLKRDSPESDVIVVGFCFDVEDATGKRVTFPFQHVRHLWHDLPGF